MKRLVLLLILSSLAFSQCATLVSDLETANANYVQINEVDCSRPMDKTLYANLAQLAEGYSYAAQCFKDNGETDKARAYYKLAAEKYMVASDALCDTDHSIRMSLAISAGDDYRVANEPELARASYEKALLIYQIYGTEIDPKLYSNANQKLYENENPVLQEWKQVGEDETIDWIPFVIAGLVFMGIGLVVISLKK